MDDFLKTSSAEDEFLDIVMENISITYGCSYACGNRCNCQDTQCVCIGTTKCSS